MGPPDFSDDKVVDYYRRMGEYHFPGVKGTLVFDNVKDSGTHESFDTGSRRDSEEGKGRPDLLPVYAMHRLCVHYANGARKYDDRNWEKGQPLSRFWRSAFRHLMAFMWGKRDEDHLAAVVWNILGLIEIENRVKLGMLPKELDDMPSQTFEPIE